MTAKAQAYVRELAAAMGQLLDDMGKDGQSVCLHAKAKARLAYEPFREPDNEMDMTLDDAKQIIREVECR
jgi:hypothetical protein